VHSEEYQCFLQLLKEARKAAGLTQDQVAQAIGKPQSFVAKCESGERRVDVIELGWFASIYKRDLQFFIDFK